MLEVEPSHDTAALTLFAPPDFDDGLQLMFSVTVCQNNDGLCNDPILIECKNLKTVRISLGL